MTPQDDTGHPVNQGSESIFHLFPRLPGELRNLIWDNAVRNTNLPGVHFFSEGKPLLPHQHFLGYHLNREAYCANLGMSQTPLSVSNRPPSWIEGNKSSYLIDAGMWTACKESRAVMKRRYEKASSKVGFVDRGSEIQCLAILPRIDLAFFTSLSFLSFLASARIPSSGIHCSTNFATKYDPAWGRFADPTIAGSRKGSIHHHGRQIWRLSCFLAHRPEASNFWIVDIRIARATCDNSDDVLFYGDGFRLVKHYDEQMEAFIRQLNRHMKALWDFGFGRNGKRPKLGALACVYDS